MIEPTTATRRPATSLRRLSHISAEATTTATAICPISTPRLNENRDQPSAPLGSPSRAARWRTLTQAENRAEPSSTPTQRASHGPPQGVAETTAGLYRASPSMSPGWLSVGARRPGLRDLRKRPQRRPISSGASTIYPALPFRPPNRWKRSVYGIEVDGSRCPRSGDPLPRRALAIGPLRRLVPIGASRSHHEDDPAQRGGVGERVAVERDDVRLEPGRNGSDLVLHLQRLGG